MSGERQQDAYFAVERQAERDRARDEKRNAKMIPRSSAPPPTFTERELRCVAWLIAALGWIPAAWAPELRSISKKLRRFLGNEAIDENADRTRRLADEVSP